jgi:hypothetical protein
MCWLLLAVKRKKMAVLGYLVDRVGFSNATVHFQSNALTSLCSRNLLVFYLHGLHRLFQLCGGSFDEDSVANRNWSLQFYDCHAYLCEKMRHLSNFLKFFTQGFPLPLNIQFKELLLDIIYQGFNQRITTLTPFIAPKQIFY